MNDARKILEGYYWANKEVERMEKRRRRLEKKAGETTVDTVRGSMSDYPYIERVVKIEGKYGEALTELRYQIDQQIREGLEARKTAEELIASAEDPRTREILRSKYIDNLSWTEVGKKNNVDPDHARKIVRDFIKRVS